MLTRCPHCETTFRVSPEQLKVRQGKVRCGACREVFDALDRLADEPTVIAAPATAFPLPPETPAEPPQSDAEVLPEPELAEVVAPEPEPAVEPQPDEPAPEPEPEVDPQPECELEPAIEPEPEALPEPAPEPEPAPAQEQESRRWQDGEPQARTAASPDRPWVWGVAALLFVAILQSLLVFRVELAVTLPGLRPALEALCAPLGCAVPFPQKPELIGIESSDLAPGEHGHLDLTATLRNRAPFVQAYPHLELTLTDARDEAVVRKVLLPAEFLPEGKVAADGFAERGEVAVKLAIEAPEVAAVGYRLYLFYP